MEQARDVVTVSGTQAMEQAVSTAAHYLSQGIYHIDNEFGKGYAKKHPELLAAFIAAATSDCNLTIGVKVLGIGLSEIAEAIDRQINE